MSGMMGPEMGGGMGGGGFAQMMDPYGGVIEEMPEENSNDFDHFN
jgi:hypothetical protein